MTYDKFKELYNRKSFELTGTEEKNTDVLKENFDAYRGLVETTGVDGELIFSVSSDSRLEWLFKPKFAAP